MRLPIHLLCLLVLVVPVSACSIFELNSQVRGTHIDADDMKEIVVGTSTRADVAQVLGHPTAHASFDDNTWIYIGEVTRPRIAQIQGVESQNVVVMTFDQGGVLRKIKRLDQDDAVSVDVVDRTTPSPGSSASFLQQLLGNIGRYSPGGLAGAAATNAGPGAGGMGSTGNAIGNH